MATLTDVFNGDAFKSVALTAAIAKLPAAPTTIGDLGIFREVPVPGTLVAVEENQGQLMLVPTTKRGGAGTPMGAEKRKATPLVVPHIQVDDTVTADDVLNVRAFGSTDANQGVTDVVSMKMVPMRRSIDVTKEYLRLGALLGVVTYPSGSVNSNIDLFSEFGTSKQTVQFTMTTSTTNVIEDKCSAVRDAIESALGGTPYSGIYALCGRTFFRTLIAHPRVRDNFLQQQALLNGQLGQVRMQRANRQIVTLGGITFEEYYGVVSGTTFINADNAVAFPIGADIFLEHLAPADLPEAAGTLGLPIYLRQYLSPDQKRVHLEAQSNPLAICTRPRALIECVKNT